MWLLGRRFRKGWDNRAAVRGKPCQPGQSHQIWIIRWWTLLISKLWRQSQSSQKWLWGLSPQIGISTRRETRPTSKLDQSLRDELGKEVRAPPLSTSTIRCNKGSKTSTTRINYMMKCKIARKDNKFLCKVIRRKYLTSTCNHKPIGQISRGYSSKEIGARK